MRFNRPSEDTFDPAKRKATLDNRGRDMALAAEILAGPTSDRSFRPRRREPLFRDRLVERPDGPGRVDAARRWSSDYFHDESA